MLKIEADIVLQDFILYMGVGFFIANILPVYLVQI